METSDLENIGRPITETEVADFEAVIGAKLPEDYRLFLMKTNGGRVREEHGYYYLEESDWMVRAHFFFGLRRPDVGVYELASVLESIRENYPETFGGCYKLPIATDDFGNKFYMSLQGSDRGSVYYWMHGGDGTDDDFINASFSGFFKSLSEDKEATG